MHSSQSHVVMLVFMSALSYTNWPRNKRGFFQNGHAEQTFPLCKNFEGNNFCVENVEHEKSCERCMMILKKTEFLEGFVPLWGSSKLCHYGVVRKCVTMGGAP